MTIDVTYEVRGARHVPKPPQNVALPEIKDSREWNMKFPDRFGKTMNRHPWLIGIGAVAGAVGGGMLVHGPLGRGKLLTTLGMVVGVALGTATATYAAQFLGLIDSPFHKPGKDARAADPIVKVDEHVRVMTYNMRGGIGKSGYGSTDGDLDRLAKEIKRNHPDIVLLQEVDDYALRSSLHDNLSGITDRLDPDSAIAGSPGYLMDGRWQGVAVLTFNGYKLESARNLVHPVPGNETLNRIGRNLTKIMNGLDEIIPGELIKEWATDRGLDSSESRNTLDTMVISPGGNEIRVLTGHYRGSNRGKEPGYLERQEGEVVAAIKGWDGPTIYGGDYNIRSSGENGTDLRKLLESAKMTDSFSAIGIPPGDHRRDTSTQSTISDIDRIYSSPQFTATNVEVQREGHAPSDHLPVVADFDLHTKNTQSHTGSTKQL